MPRPKTHDDVLRTRLLDRAGELLSSEGPQSLSLRRLAADVNTSTTAVYSLFGGKPALVRELYVEGFRRFGERLAELPRTGDHIEDLIQLGLAYRESALADRHLYSIMFGKPVPEFEPDAEAAARAGESMRPLLNVVRAGVQSGAIGGETAEVIAMAAWGLAHG
ncbi:MAG: TetR family transcriptional regulator, partial [Pseudonocardiaceae bacterium]|nr:TetR family transcriptional regulator [Pseudonocardiaceae bacterium]